MAQYYHAHKVLSDRCRGHMTCMRRCPTQAIRIRSGKSIISEELCIDCGICISVCTSNAIVPITDPLGELWHFKYKVVVPSAVLYTQFDAGVHPYIIHQAFQKLGFDEVIDVDTTYSEWATALRTYISRHRSRLPLISSHCPSVIRLIQVKYPDLVELVVPLDVPREITARQIRKTLSAKMGLRPEEIGIVYVAPCPAKIVSIKQPAEKVTSWFDGAVSIADVYPVLLPQVVALKEQFDESQVPKDFTFSVDWTTLGGTLRSIEDENWLIVSGIDHVMKIFDDIENSRLRNIDFVEALACMLGCIGGTFGVENLYVARANGMRQASRYGNRRPIDVQEIERRLEEGHFLLESPVLPRPTKYFDTDLETSIKRMKERERIYQKLPRTDCGCCGAPTCLAFAEDLVRGEAQLTDCIFLSQAAKNEHPGG